MVFLRKDSVLRSRARVFIAGIRVAGFPFENCRPLWKLPLPPPSFMKLREKYPEERCPVMTFLPKRIPNWLEELKVMTILALESQNSRVATQNWVPQTFPFSETISVNYQRHLEIQWHRQDSALAFYLSVLLEHHAAHSWSSHPCLGPAPLQVASVFQCILQWTQTFWVLYKFQHLLKRGHSKGPPLEWDLLFILWDLTDESQIRHQVDLKLVGFERVK